MGKIQILTKEQEAAFVFITQNPFFQSSFYFTGGTALSEVYLQHRESIDLDFFTDQPLDTQRIFPLLHNWAVTNEIRFTPQFRDPVYICLFEFPSQKTLKVDFASYPYPSVAKKTSYRDFPVDSSNDIAVNKLLTINQRTDVKDFVDLYFLLQEFTVWDLIYGVEHKFTMKLDPFIVAADMLTVEDFQTLPKMHKPLTLQMLKAFFQKEAKTLGKLSVE